MISNLAYQQRSRSEATRMFAIRFAPALLFLLGCLVTLFAGWAAADGQKLYLVPIVAPALYIVLAPTTLVPYSLVVLAASTFSSAYWFPSTLHFYPAELFVLFGLALLPFSNHRTLGGATGVLMGVLLFAIFSGIEVSRLRGLTTFDAIDSARPMVLYASFWLALAALRANPRRFLHMMAWFAVFIVLIQIVQLALSGHTIIQSSGETFVVPEPGGFTRVRPPGLVIVYFAFIFSLAYLLWGPQRDRRRVIAFTVVCSLGILISLNRNMMVGAVVGLLAAVFMSKQRSKALGYLVGAGVLIALVLTFAGSGAIGTRILSLGNPSGLQQTTLSDREYEDSKALPVIERHLIFGIGWSTSYGATIAEPGTGDLVTRNFIHNQYYGLLLRTGILGFLAYVGLLGIAFLTGVRWLRQRADRPDGWIGAALVASVVAFAASAVVGIYVIDPGSTPGVAALFAFTALLRERLALGSAVPAGTSENLLATAPTT